MSHYADEFARLPQLDMFTAVPFKGNRSRSVHACAGPDTKHAGCLARASATSFTKRSSRGRASNSVTSTYERLQFRREFAPDSLLERNGFEHSDRQRFRGFVRVGPIYRRTGHLTSAGLGIPIELSGGGPRSRHSPPGSGGAIHRRAVGGASAWRNRWFESVSLQQRVTCKPVPRCPAAVRACQRRARLELRLMFREGVAQRRKFG